MSESGVHKCHQVLRVPPDRPLPFSSEPLSSSCSVTNGLAGSAERVGGTRRGR